MEFIFTINTDNDAFANGSLGHEIARLLHETATTIEQLAVTNTEFCGDSQIRLHDSNGNFVGHAEHRGA